MTKQWTIVEKVIAYIISAIVFICAVAAFSVKGIYAGILMLLIAVFCIPKIQEYIFKAIRCEKRLMLIIRIAAGIIFIIAILHIPVGDYENRNNEPESMTSIQESTTEAESQTQANEEETQSDREDNFEDIFEDNTVYTEVTFDEIYNEFKLNRIRAKEKYDNKKFKITAVIEDFSDEGLSNRFGSRATITLRTEVNGETVLFKANFDEYQKELIMALNVGDVITFIGRCDGGNFKSCELEEQ